VQGREPIDHRRYRRLINLLLVRGEWFRAKDIAEQLGDRRYSERSRCSWAVAKLSTLHRKGWVVRRERFEDGQRIIEFAFRELA
jgi:hypothetical protein